MDVNLGVKTITLNPGDCALVFRAEKKMEAFFHTTEEKSEEMVSSDSPDFVLTMCATSLAHPVLRRMMQAATSVKVGARDSRENPQ